MKIRVEYSGLKDDAGDEYQARCEVQMNGKIIARASNFADCPEDANLGRDLRFVYRLHEALRAAHMAGLDGEDFTVDFVENAE